MAIEKAFTTCLHQEMMLQDKIPLSYSFSKTFLNFLTYLPRETEAFQEVVLCDVLQSQGNLKLHFTKKLCQIPLS